MTKIPPSPAGSSLIAQELGAEILERSEGHALVRFPVQERFKIPTGVLQGGMYAVMMDMAMAVASDGGISTTTLQINLLRPAKAGHVLVRAEIVRRGRNVMYLEAEVRNEDDVLLARGNQTAMAVPPTIPREMPD